jgi:hypothetical protein
MTDNTEVLELRTGDREVLEDWRRSSASSSSTRSIVL